MSVPQKILLVDDSEDQILFISQILEDNGYQYTIARNGVEAIDMLQKERPALVLLDIMMPKKSGLSVLTKIREDSDLTSIPVIIVSGSLEVTGVDMKTGSEEAPETYIDDTDRDYGGYIHRKLKELKPDALVDKPVDPPVLVAKMKDLLP